MVKAEVGVKASILASLLIQREMLGDETQEVSCVSRVYNVYLYHGITVSLLASSSQLQPWQVLHHQMSFT